jgi:hypothetical protein
VSGALLQRGTVVAFMLVALTACSPLYLPPVPGDALVVEPRLRLLGDSVLEVAEDGALSLVVVLAEVPHEGWLAIQWFGPAGGVVASDSVWLERDDAGNSLTVALPEATTLRSGEWRAVVSWYGELVRQFRVLVP